MSTQVHSGQVLRIDPRTGEKTVLADLYPGLDNLTFADGRLFVSNFSGEITEILGDGQTRTVLPGGLNWPLDLTVGCRRQRSTSPTGPTSTSLLADGTLRTGRHAVHAPASRASSRGLTAARRRRVHW